MGEVASLNILVHDVINLLYLWTLNRQVRTALGRTKMLYKEDRITYDFGKFKMMQRFDDAIRNGVIKMDMRNDEEKQLSKKISICYMQAS